jgi:hypothetical protein
MHPTKKDARVAGFLYLALVVFGPVRLIYIPNKLIVSGNATATANNITAHETLFRLGIVSDLMSATIAIFVTLALYRLLKGVNESLAVLMVILGSLMVTPIYFINTVNDAAALVLVRGADFLSVFDKAQRDALAMLFLRLHHAGIVANEIFWGLWLIPFGLLVYRSRFLPRLLGVWLVLNSLPYLATSFTGVLFPRFEATVWNIGFPLSLGELAIMLWLLIRGIKVEPVAVAATASSRAAQGAR